MKLLVSGSIAFDYLMSFPGLFREHILPENLDSLSVSFLVDHMRRAYGGCGPNIAYNLALLGERPLLIGAAGQDFGEYRSWLESSGVDTSNVLVVADEFTASFFVSTDREGNQIATFYIGAMDQADRVSLHDAGVEPDDIVIVSPNKPEAMIRHAAEAKEAGARFVFDPSQQIPRLTAEELVEAMRGAYVLALNDYEYALLKAKTGYSDQQVQEQVEALIVTHGAKGSSIWVGGERISVPSVRPVREVDPTGVGDAYRAGLLKSLAAMLDWETCGRMGSLAACYVLEEGGTQEHRYTREDFLRRYQEAFGDVRRVAEVIGAPIAEREPAAAQHPGGTSEG